MIFTLTTAGLNAALTAGANGPYVNLLTFKLGSAVAYTPTAGQTDINGSLLHQGAITNFRRVDTNTVEYVLRVNASFGDFKFGEIGLFDATGIMFAIVALNSLQEKIQSLGPQVGNEIEIDCRIQLTNAAAIFNFPIITTAFANLVEINDAELLNPPSTAGANAFIVHNLDNCGNSGIAVRHDNTSWSFSTHKSNFSGVVGSGTSNTTLVANELTYDNISEIAACPAGKYILVFTSGVHAGVIRYVDTRSSTNSVTFSPAVGSPPAVGTTFKIFKSDCSCCDENGVLWANTVEYNEFARRINRVIGTPTLVAAGQNFGYNQTQIPLLPVPQTPTAAQWQLLYDKLNRGLGHQNEALSQTPLPVHHFWFRNANAQGIGLWTVTQDYNKLDASIVVLENHRNQALVSTLLPLVLTNSTKTRSTGWNTSCDHIINVDFGDYNRLAGFFNSQGSLDYSCSLVSPIDNDDVVWQSLFSSLATIKFRFSSTTTNGAGSVSNSGFGFYDLTTSFSTITTHTISGKVLTVSARYIAAGQLELKMSFSGSNFAGSGSAGYYAYSNTSTAGTTISRVAVVAPDGTFLNSPVISAPTITHSGNF